MLAPVATGALLACFGEIILRVRIRFQNRGTAEGNAASILHQTNQCKADGVATLLTSRKAHIIYQRGHVHQPVRVMLNTINAARRDCLAGLEDPWSLRLLFCHGAQFFH